MARGKTDSTRSLLDVARTLAESGEPWSMARLAREAKVSRATLYRRFQSRDEVEQALLAAGVEAGAMPRPSRERCLDAVGVLITTLGPARMTIEAVAHEAKLGVASVYRIFGSRKGLLEAFTVERSPRALVEAAMVDDEAPLESTLEALVGAVLQQVFEHAPWLGLALASDEDSRELVADFVAVEREGRARLVSVMDRRVRRGELWGEPRVLAEALLSLAAGRALFSRSEGRSPTAEDARALVRIFVHGAQEPHA